MLNRAEIRKLVEAVDTKERTLPSWVETHVQVDLEDFREYETYKRYRIQLRFSNMFSLKDPLETGELEYAEERFITGLWKELYGELAQDINLLEHKIRCGELGRDSTIKELRKLMDKLEAEE